MKTHTPLLRIFQESGGEITQVSTFYDGYLIEKSIHRTDLGGDDLTQYLSKLLQHKIPIPIVQEIKETLSSFNKENSTTSYQLPDGQSINIGNERFHCLEPLFHPFLLGKEMLGLHQLVYSSIMKSDIDMRRDLYNNVVLSGGNTLLTGIEKRLENELKEMVPKTAKVKIVAPNGRRWSSWLGASVFAHLEQWTRWISSKEYQEEGPAILYRKCR